MSDSANPISGRQFAANRANAQRSTGPRTPEGKARSARNARKHGFTASSFSVVRLEELDEIARLKDDLVALYQPVNSQELFAVERIALAQAALLRIARLEAGLFTAALDEALSARDQPLILMDDALTADIEITRAQNRNYALAFGFHRMARQANSWSLFLRYQAQAERLYRRAIEEFERLKARRAESPNEPISDTEPEQTEATSPADETNPFPPANSLDNAPPALPDSALPTIPVDAPPPA